MRRLIYLVTVLICLCCAISAIAQHPKLLGPAEIAAMMTNSSTTYLISGSPADSIRSVAIENLFPLQEEYIQNPIVTGPVGDRKIEHNTFPGLTGEAAQRAEKAFEERDFATARTEYNNILKASPGCYLAISNLGDCFMIEGKYDSALVYYNRSISMAPLDYLGYINRADLLYDMGRYDDARKDLIEVLTLRPRYHNVRIMLDRMPKLGVARHDSLFVPAGYAYKKGDAVTVVFSDDKSAQPWMWYAMAKGLWLGEPAHRKSLSSSTDISWSSTHEIECLSALVSGYESLKDTIGKISELETIESVINDELTPAFIYYEIASRFDENIMVKADDDLRDMVRKYIGMYIMPKG